MIHPSQIAFQENPVQDQDHKIHIPSYRIYRQFQTDPFIPYYGSCPVCKEINEDNRKFVEERDGVRPEW